MWHAHVHFCRMCSAQKRDLFPGSAPSSGAGRTARKAGPVTNMTKRPSRYALLLTILAAAVATLASAACSDDEDTTPDEPATTGAPKQYAAPPPMTIDADKTYTATFRLKGDREFVVELYPKEAPVTVNSFVFLARDGYYDGVTFHRVIEGMDVVNGITRRDPNTSTVRGDVIETINISEK